MRCLLYGCERRFVFRFSYYGRIPYNADETPFATDQQFTQITDFLMSNKINLIGFYFEK